MRNPVFAIVGVLGLCGTAMAADLPPPVVKTPPYFSPAPIFTWSGFYAGVNFGYGWGSGSGTVTYTALAPIGASGPISGSGNGFLGGAPIGYHWQIGSFVLGAEADFQLSEAAGTYSGNVGAVTFTGTGRNLWFGTFRGRLGYALDQFLVFGTGGGYVAQNKFSGTDSTGASWVEHETGWGWTIGAGVEYALFQSWSIKGEYLYLSTPSAVPTQPGTTVSGSMDSHIVRAGLNFRF